MPIDFQKIVETAQDAIYLFDLDGNMIYANSKACEIINCKDPVGKSLKELVSENRLKWYLERVNQIKNKEPIYPAILALPTLPLMTYVF